MALKYELAVANGTYMGSDRTQKTSWLKIGAVMSKQNGGFVMKLDAIPTNVIDKDGNSVAFNGWVNMFEPKPRDNQSSNGQANTPAQQERQASPPADDGFDEIPF
jgi:hypothetical protein